MNIKQRINNLAAVYDGADEQPDALTLEKGDLQILKAMTDTNARTWFVIGLGYFGRGQNILEAADNCLEAGCDRKDSVSVILVVGDNNAKFISVFNIEYKDGATGIFLGRFKQLSHLLTIKP